MNEFITLFAGYASIPLVIVFIGAILCCLESYTKNFMLFISAGWLFIIGGTIARLVMGGTFYHFLIIVAFVITVRAINHVFTNYLSKKGIINKKPKKYFKRKEVALDAEQEKLNELVGITTIATQNFDPVGTFVYKNNQFEAFSNGELIKEGDKIIISKVVNKKIFVKKV